MLIDRQTMSKMFHEEERYNNPWSEEPKNEEEYSILNTYGLRINKENDWNCSYRRELNGNEYFYSHVKISKDDNPKFNIQDFINKNVDEVYYFSLYPDFYSFNTVLDEMKKFAVGFSSIKKFEKICYNINESTHDYIKGINRIKELIGRLDKHFNSEAVQDKINIHSQRMYEARKASNFNYDKTYSLISEHYLLFIELKNQIIKLKQMFYLTNVAKSLDYSSVEYPYRVHIQGCDDSSYAKCFATHEESLKVLNILAENPSYECLCSLGFIFTN